jgi:hypothetical protein
VRKDRFVRKDLGRGVTGGSGRRGDRRAFVRHAIDGLLTEQSIGAGVEIEGDQFARFFVAGDIHRLPKIKIFTCAVVMCAIVMGEGNARCKPI